jgi:hypothetical protein
MHFASLPPSRRNLLIISFTQLTFRASSETWWSCDGIADMTSRILCLIEAWILTATKVRVGTSRAMQCQQRTQAEPCVITCQSKRQAILNFGIIRESQKRDSMCVDGTSDFGIAPSRWSFLTSSYGVLSSS